MKRNRPPALPDLSFVPVPRRASSGGWSPDRQRTFITVLAATASVAQAVAAVGMSKTGAYLLRNAEGGDDFRRAWDAAIDAGVMVLRSVAFERAIDGAESTLHVDGKPVRTIHQYDNAMLMRLLAYYDTPERAAAREAARAPQFDRAQLTERFRKLVRQVAAESVEETEKASGETEAQAVARLYGPLGRPPRNPPAQMAPQPATAPVPPMAVGVPPLPRIWTG